MCKALAKTEFHWQDSRGCTAWAALPEALLSLTLSQLSCVLCDFLPSKAFLFIATWRRLCVVQWSVGMTDLVGAAGMSEACVSGCPHLGELGMPPRCPPEWRRLICACSCHSPPILMAIWGGCCCWMALHFSPYPFLPPWASQGRLCSCGLKGWGRGGGSVSAGCMPLPHHSCNWEVFVSHPVPPEGLWQVWEAQIGTFE